ncbi:cyclic nucleotide-binding domain-containing protein 2 isoform X2 [Macrotis lagotis]|uniref:cyclic nucleotide-binding domain-containing protein 2 isoform X2 n=1 Tax=Macrotis lagotis TaxID=92651 RepID=UPI003D696364
MWKKRLDYRFRKNAFMGYFCSTTEERKERSKKPFYKLVKKIITMTKVCKILQQGLHGFQQYQIMQSREREQLIFSAWDAKTFNCEYFFRDKGHFPQKAFQITQKRPEWRDEKEIQSLCSFLQVVDSFCYYSQEIQLLLAKVIRFERFGRRRVIVKKGYKCNSFYFIFFGTVAVTSDEDGSSAFLDRNPELLSKGSSFGEMALLTDSERISTVVCMEETELLVVDKEDCFGTKLNEELKKEFQFRFNFFRKHELFKTWSDETVSRMGLCDVIRLLDLSTCHSYYKWIWKHLTPLDYSLLNTRDFVSVPRKRFKDFKLKSYPDLDFTSLKMAHLEKSKQEENFSIPKDDQFNQTDYKSMNTQKKYYRLSSSSNPFTCPMVMTEFGPLPERAVVGVYVKVHSLDSGNILGLNQFLIPDSLQDKRNWILMSQGAMIIHLKKDIFGELMDAETRGKLKELEIAYPSDNIMCQKILRENSWNIFRKDLMKLLTKYPPYEKFTAFRTQKKSLFSPLSGVLDLKTLGKDSLPMTYPIFHAKVSPSSKKMLPPLRVVETIYTPRYHIKELLPKYRSPGILLKT